ncbi:DUF2848 domain-containing protein [Streptomyces albidus (ex Kaewkla and Franco 2022)]|uniref:DUF2848 domain-containing protein n=1 Tax=Streptomyces albidus (ex Kaewkla and Franco 2022) TaxID=722709 RepID=UPI0015EE3F73|nr:DUF2848 domain-containing protein [Streptomyces albidus (ex Kaewkla and Franco 2022)]
MSSLFFTLPDGTRRTATVTRLLNAGYAGRSQEDVAAHVAELAELGVPAPSTTPALYPVSPYLAQQVDTVAAQHGKTSGEAEWALVVDDTGDLLLTAACDHTDRELETYGVAWSKNAGPDVLAESAWRLTDVADRLDSLTLRAWVTGEDGTEELIQDGTAGELLTPHHWADVLKGRGELEPGTVLISGTIPMRHGVNQFAARWRVQLADPDTGREISLGYDVVPMPEPIG